MLSINTFRSLNNQKQPGINEQCDYSQNVVTKLIDLLAILRKSLDRAIFLYIFIREVRSNDVKAFYRYCAHSKILQNVNKPRSIEILFQNS